MEKYIQENTLQLLNIRVVPTDYNFRQQSILNGYVTRVIFWRNFVHVASRWKMSIFIASPEFIRSESL